MIYAQEFGFSDSVENEMSVPRAGRVGITKLVHGEERLFPSPKERRHRAAAKRLQEDWKGASAPPGRGWRGTMGNPCCRLTPLEISGKSHQRDAGPALAVTTKLDPKLLLCTQKTRRTSTMNASRSHLWLLK